MKKFFFLSLLIIVSMGFILRIKIEPFNKDLFLLLKENFYRKFYLFCNFLKLYKDLRERNILIRRISFYPWTLYFSWEEEYTLIKIQNGNNNIFVNQKGEIMSIYRPKNNTVKVNNSVKKTLKEIINLVHSLLKENIDVREIILNSRFFEIKTSSGSILMSYDNIEEKIRIFKHILSILSDKNYFIDMRFKVPAIKG